MSNKLIFIMILLCFSFITHSKEPISCGEEKMNNPCEVTLKYTSEYTLNLIDIESGSPIFDNDLLGGMLMLTDIYKIGDKYLFIRKSQTHSGLNQAVLFKYVDKKIIILNYLELGYYYNMNIIPGERRWTGSQCELNVTVERNIAGDDDLFSISQDACNNLIDRFPIELEKDVGDIFQIRSYTDNKIVVKKAFFINNSDWITDIVCIKHCDNLNSRFYGKINNIYPFIMNYNFAHKESLGDYYYLKHKENILLSGTKKNNSTFIYGLDDKKNQSELFLLYEKNDGYSGMWQNLRNNKKYPIYLYPMLY